MLLPLARLGEGTKIYIKNILKLTKLLILWIQGHSNILKTRSLESYTCYMAVIEIYMLYVLLRKNFMYTCMFYKCHTNRVDNSVYYHPLITKIMYNSDLLNIKLYFKASITSLKHINDKMVQMFYFMHVVKSSWSLVSIPTYMYIKTLNRRIKYKI